MVATEHEEIYLDDLGLSLDEQVGHLLCGPRALCRGCQCHCQTECLSLLERTRRHCAPRLTVMIVLFTVLSRNKLRIPSEGT